MNLTAARPLLATRMLHTPDVHRGMGKYCRLIRVLAGPSNQRSMHDTKIVHFAVNGLHHSTIQTLQQTQQMLQQPCMAQLCTPAWV